MSTAWTLTAVMDGIAALLTTASLARNVYAWPADSISVPCAVVGYPTEMTYDSAFDRGGDSLTLPVWFVIGRTGSKDARDALSAVLAGTDGLKAALDGERSFGDVRVMAAAVDEFTVNAIAYLAARFDVEVYV